MRGEHMRNYGRSDRSTFVAVGLVVISFLMMTFDIRSSSQGVGGTLRTGVQAMVAPIQNAMNAVIDPVVDFADGLANLAGLRLENDRLRSRIEDLERDVVHVENLEADVAELGELLALQLLGDLQDIAVNAEVTGRGGTFEQSFTINKGTVDGIQIGQPVVDARGALVGVISEVTERSASVIPITSRQAPGVTVRLPNGVRGSVEGQGTGRLILSILDAGERVLEGQLLQTFGPYGSSDAYPKGLDVGTVLSSATPQSGSIRVQVEPLADLDRIEFVAVIPWPPDPGGTTAETETQTTTPALDENGNPIPEPDAESIRRRDHKGDDTMSARPIALSLVFVVMAVLIQTTLFNSVRPFGASPDLVLLTVIACARWMEPEPGVLLGFTCGVMIDLFGSAPLGLQGLAFTLVAYITVRTRDRFDYSALATGLAVGLLSLIGVVLVAVVGTLFGQGTLGSPDILKTFMLVPAYNIILGLVVLPMVASYLGTRTPASELLL